MFVTLKLIPRMAPRMMIVKNNPNVFQWSIETGYKVESNEDVYPFRAIDSGRKSGLDLILTISEQDIVNNCDTLNQGFTVALSVPGEELKQSQTFLRLPLLEHVRVSIKPKLITTSKGLFNYDPSQRQCFYDSEHQLRFYKNYSRSNCEMECLSIYTENKCGCVKMFMPSKLCSELKIIHKFNIC